jgi:hypothetical protein
MLIRNIEGLLTRDMRILRSPQTRILRTGEVMFAD